MRRPPRKQWFEVEQDDPGVLPYIAGEIIAAASLTLPDAAQAETAVRTFDIDAQDNIVD